MTFWVRFRNVYYTEVSPDNYFRRRRVFILQLMEMTNVYKECACTVLKKGERLIILIFTFNFTGGVLLSADLIYHYYHSKEIRFRNISDSFFPPFTTIVVFSHRSR